MNTNVTDRTITLVRAVRHAARALSRRPAFTVTVLLTLALGIGATTVTFSIVNGILLQPLPYQRQDRLIELIHEAPGMGLDTLFASPAIYFAYRDHNETFDAVGLWDWDDSPATVTGEGTPESVPSLEVTHEILDILGADPLMGRNFTEADDVPGSAPTVIISYGYWQRRFGGTDVLGRTLVVKGVPREVVGVLAPSFRFFDYAADLFYPLQPVRSAAGFPAFDGRGLARLKTGVTLEQANADVARMIPILVAEFGGAGPAFENARFGPKLRWLKDSVVGDLGETLWTLMGTIAILLLIACANVANLMLVRAEARRHEVAIRTALGADRGHIAGLVWTESALLVLAGGIAGLGVAYLALPILLSMAARDLPGIMVVTIDPVVALFTLGTCALAALLFALLPMTRFGASKLSQALHLGGRAVAGERAGSRTRNTLVVAQVALALLLLVGSGLMIRSFQALRHVDPGFDPANVQTFTLRLPGVADGAGGTEQMVRMQNEILERLAAVPGVESAGFAGFDDPLPLDGDGRTVAIVVEGLEQPAGADGGRELQFVSPSFFETLRTPLVAGRTFDWNDIYGRRAVALVSENYARTIWGSAGAALGKRIRPGPAPSWSEVVGVIGAVHHYGLSQPPPEAVAFPLPLDLDLRGTATFAIRSDRVGQPGFLDELESAVWAVNGGTSLANVRTLGDLYQRSMARTSMTLLVLAIVGTIALLLGVIGIYGAVSYAVSERRREIGIRIALGAPQSRVRRSFVANAVLLAGIGVAVGLVGAVGLAQLLASQLYAVRPIDAPTYAVVALVLVSAAALAGYIPARRASAVDPMDVLKAE